MKDDRDDRPGLRSDLNVEPHHAESLVVLDPVTSRAFVLDEVQAAVVRELAAGKTCREIACELLDGSEDEERVSAFLEQLASLALLDLGLEDEDVATRQADALRELNRAALDANLARTLAWAGASIPFHRERFGAIADQIRTLSDLPRLPAMTKADIRENFPGRLLPDGVDGAELLRSEEIWLYATSGTTGDRLQVFYDAHRTAYPQSFPGIRPVRKGWSGARIGIFTTPVCSGAVCHMGQIAYEDRLLHGGAYLNLQSSDRVMSLNRTELGSILDDIERFQPSILRVDPVYAVALVRALEREHLPVPKVDAIWTAYEYCSALHRPILEAAFGVPVFTVYAATDLGGGCQAFRCENGVFHVRQNQYVFEFARGEKPVSSGEVGEILVTSTYHRFMPLVRYRVQDLGRPLGRTCRCSHGDWPAFQLEGRLRDCVLDTRGGLVTTKAFDDLFEGVSWIDFYQLTQVSSREYELLTVRRPGSEQLEAELFLERARGLLGEDARIRIRMVREIPTEKSFKFRLTASALWQPDAF